MDPFIAHVVESGCTAGFQTVAGHPPPSSTRNERQCGGPLRQPSVRLQRHDVAPASKSLPAGAKQHLVLLSLGRGQVDLERGGESIRRELELGSVAVYPAGLPIRWSWRTPLSYSVLSLEPKFLNQVACRIYGAAPGDFELLPSERAHDVDLSTLLAMVAREAGPAGPDSAF